VPKTQSYSDIVSVATIPVWFAILEASTWANTHAFKARRIALLGLGVCIVSLLVVNIATFVAGIRAYKTRRLLRTFLGICLNGFQIGTILLLIVFGIYLNAKQAQR